MMMENKVWLSKVLEVLQEFSSREFQERIWLHGLGPEVSSYEEAMCRLFDDLGFSRLIDVEWRQSGLSESQMLTLKEFRENLLKFDKDIPEIPAPTDILNRPSWEDVREYATKAAEALGCTAGG
jgi:hypothetical protein